MSWSPFRDAKTRAEWRELLALKQHGRCALCGHSLPRAGELRVELERQYEATFHHIVPRSQGGTDELGNLRLVHWVCNRERGDGNRSRVMPTVPKVLRSPE